MSRRLLITGGGGFVGQWLAKAALTQGDQVWLAGLGETLPHGALSASERASVRWTSADITKDGDVDRLVHDCAPSAVAHLAGLSFVPEAEKHPARAYEINVVGTVRLLSALVAGRPDGSAGPTVLVVGSGTQYGNHDERKPLVETSEQRPASVYAATKVAQETAALQLFRATGIRAVCARSFSHSGRGQADHFLLPALVRRIRDKTADSLRVGNDVIRDYLHVQDVVAAYLALIDHGVPGEVYNVSSGQPVTVMELAHLALSVAGRNTPIVSDVEFQRPSDMPYLVGAPEKLMAATRWRPTRTHREILEDLFSAT